MESMRMRRRLSLASLVFFASALATRADVLVVDKAAGPGHDFTSIQSAVSAAVDGDTILIRAGGYYPFSIVGKSLAIVADGDSVTVTGSDLFGSLLTFQVRDLAAGQRVVIRGLKMNSGFGVQDCAGKVWCDELEVSGAVPCTTGGTAGAYVDSSSDVTFTSCVLRGESADDLWHVPHPSAHGLHVVSSNVQLYDSLIEGGWGQDSQSNPLVGGTGIRIESSTVTVVGCEIHGGEGGLVTSNLCHGAHAAGGPGVSFVGGTGTIRSAASTAEGGVADLGALCPGATGPQGPAVTGGGTIVALAGFARQLSANSPVRGGQTLTFEVAGLAGELPAILVSLEHAPLLLPAQHGWLLVGLPLADLFVLPPLPAGGAATLAFAVPNVSGLESLGYYAQAVFLDPAPAVWLGSGTTVVLLDASF